MKYDDVYEYVGQIGVFQLCTIACILLYCLFALDSVTMIFVGANMPHWCRVKQLANLSYDLQKSIAIPMESDEYSSCEMYALDYDNYSTEEYLAWNRTQLALNDTQLVPCSQWIYEQTVFISTIVSRFDLVCQWGYLVPLVSTFCMAGGLIGAAVGGPFADRFGRKVALLVMLAIKVVGVALSTFSPNYATHVVGRFIIGVGSVALYNTSYVLSMEMVGPKYRSLIGGSVQMATSLCFVLQPLIAYMDRHDVTYQLASMGPNALIFLIALVICESPRWLVVNGRYDDAEAIFRQMAEVNQKQLPADFNAEKIENDETSTGSVLLLFRFPVMRIRTLILSYVCFASNLIYFSLSLNTGALYGDIFLNTLISASLEVPAIILCIVVVDWKHLGRKFTNFLTFFTSSLCCLLCIPMTLFDIGVGETVLSITGKSLSVMAFTAMYIFSSEIFPTEVRNAGMGVIMVFGGIANMAASFVGQPMAQLWRPLPYVVLGSCGVLASIMCLALPETLRHPLQDTVEQAEQFKGGKIVRVEVAESISVNGTTGVSLGDVSNDSSTNCSKTKHSQYTNNGFTIGSNAEDEVNYEMTKF